MRIVRMANFVTPTSGGLRTALAELGTGYRAAGHDPVLVVPGARYSDELTQQGRVITMPGKTVPGTGGYRVLTQRRELARLLDSLRPDRLEVSDRSTLRWTGTWARQRGVRSMMVSHESLAGLLELVGPSRAIARNTANRLNSATANKYDTVACTTSWAAAEFSRLGVPNLQYIPLGVDLDTFHPDRYDPWLRHWLAPNGELLLVHCGRLSPEKRPGVSVEALAELRRLGLRVVLVIVGDGPMRRSLEAQAGKLLVRFLGFVRERDQVARLLATADAALAPGPVETFGLAALEGLASGTPVVVNSASALPEVVDDAGAIADGDGESFSNAVMRLLAMPEDERRFRARARAEHFGWASSVDGFLRAHDLPQHAVSSGGDGHRIHHED